MLYWKLENTNKALFLERCPIWSTFKTNESFLDTLLEGKKSDQYTKNHDLYGKIVEWITDI